MILCKLKYKLFEPKRIESIAIFRIGFGVISTLQLFKFYDLTQGIALSNFRIPWAFFEWIQPFGPIINQWFFTISIIGAIAFTLGIWYRLTSIFLFIGLTYPLLLDVSLYNNHYYLMSLFALLFCVTDAHKSLSIPAIFKNKNSSNNYIPRWQLGIFQFTIVLVYFFGAIAKFNSDWLLRAQPIQLWLPSMIPGIYAKLNVVQQQIIAYGFSWSGFLIDLSVPFLLFHPRWKWIAIVTLVAFHTSNIFLFSIGYFPYLGLFSLLLFLGTEIQLLLKKDNLSIEKPSFKQNRIAFVFVICFVGLQILMPLRQHLFPGNYRWTGSGYFYAWTMKLTDINPLIRFEAKIEGIDEPLDIDYNYIISDNQKSLNFILGSVWNLTWFANYCETWIKTNHPRYSNKEIAIYCDSYISINNHSYQRKVDPNVDLTNLELHPIKKYFQQHDWIIPFGSDTLIDHSILLQLTQNDSE